MTESQPSSAAQPEGAANWEAFYRDYRKPGYVPGFEITTKLGGGMFGLVFRARKQSIGKDYAIKFLQVDDTEVRRAVLLELEQVKFFAQIDHPNLVSIEDRGEVDGIPFLVMSFAGTETLRDRMPTASTEGAQVPTPAEKDELLRYFLQCCRGLAALHERSLVHFDIKPANVFLKGAVARLGDYGLSKLITHSRGSLSMGRGTPYYMAPEMLQRRGDHRSDIYSLGVMLYEILCGCVPFTGDSEWEVLRKHEKEAPSLPAHLSGLERALLQRCLQKDPTARFQSVHDLIAAFGAPSSVGAAAWTDVRNGATPLPSPSPSPAPPPRGSSVPPPLPKQPPPLVDDPYTGLGRASRDAARHAKKIARQALEKARTESKKHFAGMHAALRRGRHRRDPVAGIEVRVKRRRSVVGKLMAVGAMFALMLLVFYTAMVPDSMAPAEVASVPAPFPPGDPFLVAGSDSLFQSFDVPKSLRGQVSMREPTWVSTARRDPDAAERAIEQHVAKLRRAAPWDSEQRAHFTRLPKLTMLHRVGEPGAAERTELVEQFVREPDFDKDIAVQIEQLGPAALAQVAARLGQVDWQSQDGRKSACRLHELLQQATGCQEIEFAQDGTMPPDDVVRANSQLADVWNWFLNEFAGTPAAWQTYQKLCRGR
ncbi:MAG: serine/threonine-protein kinase [Planctomycetota bacterium]